MTAAQTSCPLSKFAAYANCIGKPAPSYGKAAVSSLKHPIMARCKPT